MLRELRNNEKGFTLIEMMVVILIVGILMAIAVPSYVNQQKSSRDNTTKQDVALVGEALKAISVQYPNAPGRDFKIDIADHSKGSATVCISTGDNCSGSLVIVKKNISYSGGTVLSVFGNSSPGNFNVFGYNEAGKYYDSIDSSARWSRVEGGIMEKSWDQEILD